MDLDDEIKGILKTCPFCQKKGGLDLPELAWHIKNNCLEYLRALATLHKGDD